MHLTFQQAPFPVRLRKGHPYCGSLLEIPIKGRQVLAHPLVRRRRRRPPPLVLPCLPNKILPRSEVVSRQQQAQDCIYAVTIHSLFSVISSPLHTPTQQTTQSDSVLLACLTRFRHLHLLGYRYYAHTAYGPARTHSPALCSVQGRHRRLCLLIQSLGAVSASRCVCTSSLGLSTHTMISDNDGQ